MASISCTVNPDGGADYTSLQAAETGMQATYANLVGDTNTLTINCSGGVDATAAVIDGWTTNATYFITINVAKAARHTGVRGTGYRLISNADWGYVFTVNEPFTVVNGLVFHNGGEDHGFGIWVNSDGLNVTFSNCLFYDNYTATILQGGAYRTKWINNLVYGGGQGLTVYGEYEDETGGVAFNNTILNCTGTGMWLSAYSEVVLKNNFVGGCGTDYTVSEGAGVTWVTNYSEDGTGTTTTSTIANCHFTNSTAGSEDAHIDGTSSLFGVGTDLSADALYNVTVDFEDDTREATPCVGADEYVESEEPSSTISISVIVYNLMQQGFI